MTHDELAADLAAHVRGAGEWMTWCDLQLGASGSVRPDVYAIAKTYSRLHAVAYECKISRADFRSDVTKAKWQAYLKYATAVTFAVPAGLIEKAEVPPTCGLIVRHENVWRHVRRPTHQPMPELPRETWLKLLMDGVHREGARRDERHFSSYAVMRGVAKKWGEEVAKLLHNIEELPSVYAYRKQRLEDELKLDEERAEKRRAAQHESQYRSVQSLDKALVEFAVLIGVDPGDRVDDITARLSRITRAFRGYSPATKEILQTAERVVENAKLLDSLVTGLQLAATTDTDDLLEPL